MPDRYSQINLAEIEDVAPANGFADRWQARVARTPLGAQLDGEERARAVGVVPRQQRADRGRVRLTEDQPADLRRVEIEARHLPDTDALDRLLAVVDEIIAKAKPHTPRRRPRCTSCSPSGGRCASPRTPPQSAQRAHAPGRARPHPHGWASYLDETIVLFAEHSDVMLAQHHWPRWGTDRIVDFLAKQRDLYGYIHDQALRLLNKGYVAAEIAELLELPPSLEHEWHCRGNYGSLNHNLKAVAC